MQILPVTSANILLMSSSKTSSLFYFFFFFNRADSYLLRGWISQSTLGMQFWLLFSLIHQRPNELSLFLTNEAACQIYWYSKHCLNEFLEACAAAKLQTLPSFKYLCTLLEEFDLHFGFRIFFLLIFLIELGVLMHYNNSNVPTDFWLVLLEGCNFLY